MIEQQIRPWEVLDNRVLSTLDALNREDFVPEAYRGLAYADCQIARSEPLPQAHRSAFEALVRERMGRLATLGRPPELRAAGRSSSVLVASAMSHASGRELEKDYVQWSSTPWPRLQRPDARWSCVASAPVWTCVAGADDRTR